MPGPAPAKNRRRTNPPARGEWIATPGIGWQHGDVPEPPDGLVAASREAWTRWMQAWFASYWIPADLPGLRMVITAFDAVQRGATKANDLTALVRLMDTYGITPAGQQARRWSAPEVEAPKTSVPVGGQYGHLKVVNR